jgi:predicted esterase
MIAVVVALLLLGAAPALASQPPGAEGLARGRLVEGVACAADPLQTYSVFLPEGYDPVRQWPVLLVLDPGGRSVAAAGRFIEAAQELGWIVVSSDGTRSDVGMEPNRRAVNALWPEIHERFASDPRRIYLAGFSGTVGVAFLLARETGVVAGIVAAGGRFIEEVYAGNKAPVFAAAGDGDFNFQGMRTVHARMLEDGVPTRFEAFSGRHEWMPPEIARHAVEWMELQAMRRELRARDDGLVDRLLAAELAAAATLEAEGRGLDAMRQYRAVVADFEGLRDVSPAGARAAKLEADPGVARAAALELRWSEREQWERERINAELQRFLAAEPAPLPESLAAELEVARLERQAGGDGIEAATARRVLAHLRINLAVYLPQELLAARRPGHAASALGVACRMEPGNPALWYNRACALSLSGGRSSALDALERAVEAGFADADLMRTDPDLAAVRDSDRFRALLAGIGGTPDGGGGEEGVEASKTSGSVE